MKDAKYPDCKAHCTSRGRLLAHSLLHITLRPSEPPALGPGVESDGRAEGDKLKITE